MTLLLGVYRAGARYIGPSSPPLFDSYDYGPGGGRCRCQDGLRIKDRAMISADLNVIPARNSCWRFLRSLHCSGRFTQQDARAGRHGLWPRRLSLMCKLHERSWIV